MAGFHDIAAREMGSVGNITETNCSYVLRALGNWMAMICMHSKEDKGDTDAYSWWHYAIINITIVQLL